MRRRAFDPRLFHSAVRTIARYRARKAVQQQIRARGQKISQYSAKEIAELGDAYLAQHRDGLIAKAILDVCEFKEFARHRTEIQSLIEFAMVVAAEDASCANLVSAAQTPKPCSDSTISVQNSSAERAQQ